MSRSSKQDSYRWYLPAVIACALLIGGAMWASTLLPSPAPAAKTPPTVTDTTHRLGVWEGKVARWSGADTPAEVYDVAVASLPEEVQRKLEQGITVSSEEELTEWLDNLTS